MRAIVLFFLSIIFAYQSYAAHVETLQVKSKVMNSYIKNTVILPNTYEATQSAFPVVYLLHGAGGDYRDWINGAPKIKEYVDKHQLIIVCPDGGKTSWYFDSPIDPNSQYETYLSKELIEAVEVTYNTIKKRNGRAITGLSMGGHGAFYLAFKHTEIWGAAGSMSGGLDICPFPNNWEIYKRLGAYDQNKNLWEEHAVINLIDEYYIEDLQIIFDCGTEDFFYDVNIRFEAKLKQCDIPYQFIERAGKHNWAYWEESIVVHLQFFTEFFSSTQLENPSEVIKQKEKQTHKKKPYSN